MIQTAMPPAMFGYTSVTEYYEDSLGAVAPSTSSVLPRIDPVIDAFATSISPAWMAKIVMISSAALPKVGS